MDNQDLTTIRSLTEKRSKLLEQKKKIDNQLKAYEIVLGDLSGTNPRRDCSPYTFTISSSRSYSRSEIKNGNGKKTVSDIVLEYVDGLTDGFTRKQVKQYLTANYPDRKVHDNYLYTLLKRLEDREFIQIAHRGSGRRGNIYRRNLEIGKMQA